MKEEIRRRIHLLPSFVQDSIYADYTTGAIIKIKREYLKNDKDKLETLKNAIGRVIIKDKRIEDLFVSIKKKLNLSDQDAKEVTLIILTEILYPIKDYFPGIEDEILRLGGEIPKEMPKKSDQQFLKREEEMEAMVEKKKSEEETKDTIIWKSIENLMEEFPDVKKQIIGSQKSIEIENMPVPMKPMIKYWLKDYQDKMGYAWHSNLDRAHYVYHDKNTKDINEEERRQLSLVLKSLDEKILLPYSTRLKKIDFSKIEE